jgi:hypothetical protein
MNDEKKTTDGETRTPFENTACADMMQAMIGAEGKGCGCREMMERFMSQKAKSGGCADMMAACCGEQSGSEKEAQEE